MINLIKLDDAYLRKLKIPEQDVKSVQKCKQRHENDVNENVFIVHFEQISRIAVMFLLLTLNK